MNNDGILDFEFHFEKRLGSSGSGNTSTRRYLEIAPHQQNEMACSYISSYYGSPAEFVKGDTIKPDTLWGNKKTLQFISTLRKDI